MEPSNLGLCQPSTSLNDQWRVLYESAFPSGEREPVERLTKLIAEGKMLYHQTLNEQGDLVCFTMVSVSRRFSLLAYMATDPTKRSGGVGTKHLTRLIEVLKQQFPTHIGLFLEIEATAPRSVSLPQEELHTRIRRRTFYERLGARVMCSKGVYLTPSLSQPGVVWEGELMGVEFHGGLCQSQLAEVIRSIYREFYCLPADHPMVVQVLGHFAHCADNCHPVTMRQVFKQWRNRLREIFMSVYAACVGFLKRF